MSVSGRGDDRLKAARDCARLRILADNDDDFIAPMVGRFEFYILSRYRFV